jgi:hypothetical protein
MEPLTRQTGFRHAVVTCILIVIISLLTSYKKELFVAETGHLKLYGGGIGILLAIGLVLRWRYVREILAVLTAITLPIVIAFVIFDLQSPKLFARLWLLALQGSVAVLLLGSRELKAYIDSR